MKRRLYARLDKFYRNTMRNYNKKELEDEAASTERSFNDPVTPEYEQKPTNELVTSIHELEASKLLKMEKPSYRVLIKTISVNTMENVYHFQGITEEKDKDFFSLHIFIRAFLLLANVLSGVLCGLTAVMGKIFIMTSSRSTGIFDLATNVSAWITGLSCCTTVFSNLVNVNITVSLYS